MSLPIKTTMDDCEKVLGYLKTKPSGATITEARGVLDPRHLDGRKIKAYEAWALVKVDADRMLLTADGREVARDPDRAIAHYRAVIARIRPYRAVIERAHHGGQDTLLINDVAANWHDHHQDTLGTTNATSIKDAVTCFFNLAEGAGLGKYVLGRHGQETRLDLNTVAVRQFVLDEPNVTPLVDGAVLDAAVHPEVEAPGAASGEEAEAVTRLRASGDASVDELRVFITHGRNRDIVEQVETMLGVADIPYEVSIESETTAIPVPEKVIGAMRRCSAAIICVSVEEDHKDDAGNYAINENVLIEIGAAFVLYNTKVILLWDKRLKVPSNLQGLYRCEFEGDEIGFKEVMRLMKAVKDFRSADAAA
jgi:predicted nucleotide-binding protein